MSTSADKLVEDYLDRLESELADFPSARRRELVQEISAAYRRGDEPRSRTRTRPTIRNLLDRMGDPADIAAEARGHDRPSRRPRRRRRHCRAPLRTLDSPAHPAPVGGLVLPVIGWLVGVVLLWTSVSLDDSARSCSGRCWCRGPCASRGSPPRRRSESSCISRRWAGQRETTSSARAAGTGPDRSASIRRSRSSPPPRSRSSSISAGAWAAGGRRDRLAARRARARPPRG